MVDNFDETSKSASELGGVLININSQVSGILDKVSRLGEKAQDTFTGMTREAVDFNDALDDWQTDLDTWNKQLDTSGDNTKSFVDKAMEQFTRFGKFFIGQNMFENFAKDAKNQFQTIGDSASVVSDVLKKVGVPDSAVKYIDILSKTAEGGQKAEAGFYGMATASGELNKVWDENYGTLKDLTAITANYEDRLAATAAATNMSTKEVISFASGLGKVPGVMDGIVTTGDGAGKTIDSTTAALRLMTGTGQTAEDIISEFTKAQEELSNTTGAVSDSSQKAAQFISAMSQVSHEANLQFKDARSFLEGVADQFKNVGDNTDAAARVMGGFSRALQDTGLTAKASADIVGDMIKQVGNLTVGTKAFISLRTGGAGGLQGAFQFEELLRQGKLDEVMNKMQTAFRQQAGGRIYSLQEASQSPQAAAQFEKQRLLLQSGVLGIGKGSDDATATRILEALKSGNVNILKDSIKTGQKAVEDVTARGAAIQERNNTVLNQMSRFVERTAIAGELTAAAEIKRSFGTDVNSQLVDKLHREMQDATAVARQQTQGKGELNPGTADEELGKLTINAAGDIKSAAKDTITGVGTMLRDLKTGTQDRVAPFVRPAPQPVTAPPMMMPRQQDNKALTIAAQTRDIDHRRRVAGAVNTTIEQKQMEKTASKDVNLKIEVTAPNGFGVKATTPNRNVDLTRNANASTYSGGPTEDPGY